MTNRQHHKKKRAQWVEQKKKEPVKKRHRKRRMFQVEIPQRSKNDESEISLKIMQKSGQAQRLMVSTR